MYFLINILITFLIYPAVFSKMSSQEIMMVESKFTSRLIVNSIFPILNKYIDKVTLDKKSDPLAAKTLQLMSHSYIQDLGIIKMIEADGYRSVETLVDILKPYQKTYFLKDIVKKIETLPRRSVKSNHISSDDPYEVYNVNPTRVFDTLSVYTTKSFEEYVLKSSKIITPLNQEKINNLVILDFEKIALNTNLFFPSSTTNSYKSNPLYQRIMNAFENYLVSLNTKSHPIKNFYRDEFFRILIHRLAKSLFKEKYAVNFIFSLMTKSVFYQPSSNIDLDSFSIPSYPTTITLSDIVYIYADFLRTFYFEPMTQ
jgi:hypothetical protein